MKRSIALAIVALAGLTAATTASADGDRRVATQLDRPAQFSRIVLNSSADVEWTQSHDGRTSVTIIAPRDVIDDLEVISHGGTLMVGFKERRVVNGRAKVKFSSRNGLSIRGRGGNIGPWRRVSGDDVLIRATSPSLDAVDVRGSGDVSIEGIMTGDRLSVDVAGSGEVEIDELVCREGHFKMNGSGDISVDRIECRGLNIGVAGSGEVDIEHGRAAEATYTTGGSGSIDAVGVAADNVRASVAGSGRVTCHAVHSLDASVAGSGGIYYTGNPPTLHRKSAGSGGIHRR